MSGVIGPVLITGCSSGIGAATASRLAGSGMIVYATARRVDTLAGLAELGCRTLALDVTDEQSMRVAGAVRRVLVARRPPHRVVVTPVAKAMVHTRRLLGSRVWDAFLRLQFRPRSTVQG